MPNASITPFSLLRSLIDGKSRALEELAAEIACDVADVAQCAATLKAHHFNLENVEGRLRLLTPVELLSRRAILDAIGNEQALLSKLRIDTEVESTNETLLRLAQSEGSPGAIHGVVLLAEHQRGGRGRRGRRWISPMAQNMYLSLGWLFDGGIAEMAGLSLACGVAVAQAIANCTGIAVALKWPNDIYVGEEKLGGLLVETSGDPGAACAAVIGIGINVSMTPAHGDAIDQRWTALNTHLDYPVSRNTLVAEVLSQLLPLLQAYPATGFAPWRDQWQQLDYLRGAQVSVSGAATLMGQAMGVDDSGGLRIDTPSGLQTVHGGEISVRRA